MAESVSQPASATPQAISAAGRTIAAQPPCHAFANDILAGPLAFRRSGVVAAASWFSGCLAQAGHPRQARRESRSPPAGECFGPICGFLVDVRRVGRDRNAVADLGVAGLAPGAAVEDRVVR